MSTEERLAYPFGFSDSGDGIRKQEPQAEHRCTSQTEGDVPLLELPLSRPRSAALTATGARLLLPLMPVAAGILEHVELKSLFLAAWMALLYRYAGQDEVVVGIAVPGTFMPSRVCLPLSGGLSFRRLVSEVATSIDRNAKGLPPGGDLPELSAPGFSQFGFDFCSDLPPSVDFPLFDLHLTMITGNEELIATFDYNAALFDEAVICRMAGHYQTLLTGALAAPESSIAALPLLTPAERDQLLVAWNETAADFPRDGSIQALFETQAARTPEAPALIFEQRTLTYAELNGRANQLAHRLRQLGVGPEVLVGVCMERSEMLLIALLAVLKAGGAYVPLDPAYPPERILYTLEDAATPLVLTQSHLIPRLAQSAARLLCPFEAPEAESIATESIENPVRTVSALNLAYLIYTSGSTGRPKGVAIAHRSAMAMLAWAAELFPRQDLNFVLAATSICFDLSIYELYLPLSVGGAVVLARNALHLLTLPARESVTLINTVPSAIAELARAGGIPATARTINLAGEPLKRALVQQVYAASHAERIYNLYGPSEDTTYSTWFLATRDDPLEPAIGRPLSNTQAYILDAQMQPVPLGLTGELYLGGEGLSRGYLNRPALTAERYVPDPFGRVPGGRLYRTGDLVRYRPDGQIEFLGRIDHQVKIRGFRIELGEIESRLLEHPNVASVVVGAWDSPTGEKRLVAYFTAREAPAPAVKELRRHLRVTLPEYMVPAIFVPLEVMPLTATGKIDRKALPAPPPARPDLENPLVLPRNPLEELLAEIWQDVLKIGEIGIEDHFFELGGQSLLAMQVTARLNAALGRDLPMEVLFRYPTIAALAEQLMQESDSVGSSALVPADRSQPLPLSQAQVGVWFLNEIMPDLPAYNIPLFFRITGRLDVEVLQRALTEILRRHEVLRSAFRRLDNGDPAVEFYPPQPFPLTLEDLRSVPAAERDALARRRMEQAARRFFDLTRDLLIEGLLLQLGDESYQLLLNVNHIVFDGWSISVLIGDLEALYKAFAAGKPSPLAELPVQYVDYSAWQQQNLTPEVLQPHLDYWVERLQDAPALSSFPTDYPRPVTQRYQGAMVERRLPVALLPALEGLGRQADASLFMTLFAAFELLVARYSGQQDLVLASIFAGRDRAELEKMLGYFINTLPVRLDLSGNPSFLGLLERVRQVTLESFAHHSVPLARIVEALDIPRDTSYQPLVQQMFVVENYPEPAIELPGLRIEFVEELNTGTTKTDMTWRWEFPPQGPALYVEYDTDLFKAETVERLIDHYFNLLQAAVDDPHQSIQAMPLLRSVELQQLLVDWNATVTDYPQLSVPALFAAQAAKTPEAVALIWPATGEPPTHVTYGELNARANQVAHYLRRLGVQSDQLVGLCVERSVEMVVGMLGILKAGAAYLPLDPNYPQERLALMLEDAQVPVLVVQSHLEAKLPASAAQLVRLDRDGEMIGRESTADPEFPVFPDQLAYVIYTSGSTGRPKGTGVPHRGIVRLVKETNYAALTSSQIYLQLSTISFDASIFEIWGSLLNGATLVLYPAQRPTFEGLAQVLQQEKVSLLFLTTSLFNQMVEEQLPALLGVPHIFTGGEAISSVHAGRLLERLGPGQILTNVYGPTENSTYSTFFHIPADYDLTSGIPIGRPIANSTAYVLDRWMQPVPTGVAGELYVGGDGLARGYLHRPELTAEKFVPDPFSRQPGARLYGTGDLVRQRPDGAIEFLGRIDNQVKIRGFRIEPGEIEAVLLQHPSVREAAVVVTGSGSDQQLVAYVVPEADSKEGKPGSLEDGKNGRSEGWSSGSNFQLPTSSPALLVSELRSYLTGRLPAYMVPAAFVMLEAMPMTANGKVDRKALPALFQSGERTDENDEPRTPIEELVQGVWKELLKAPCQSVRQNFFELGGHSIQAIRLASRLRQLFNVVVPVQDIFERPTIATQSQLIQELLGKTSDVKAPVLSGRTWPDPLPLSFNQRQLWFMDRLAPGNPLYNVPFAFYFQGELNLEALERSVNALVQRHLPLRTTFHEVNGEPVQVIAPELTIPLSIVDLRALPEDQRPARLESLETAEAQSSFDLESGPLFRVLLIRLSDERAELILNCHHIATDGWSMGTLARELGLFYTAFALGQTPALPDLPVHYPDFTLWQQEMLESEGGLAALDYWKAQFARRMPVLELPTDHSRPAVQRYLGRTLARALSPELLSRLEVVSRSGNATLFMTLLVAFQVLLYRYTHQSELVVGTPWSGRTQPELEDLIGFFVNVLPLRLEFADNPTFNELLERMRPQVVRSQTYQDLPFERLVEALDLPRDVSYNPLFQASFALHPALAPMDLPGAQFGVARRIFNLSAKFDLNATVEYWESGPVATLEYNSDLFEVATAERLLSHFLVLLEGIAAQPAARISDLPLLSAAERDQLLREWNPAVQPLLSPILTEARIAAQDGESVALVQGAVRLTYAELNARAERLAARLQALGVGPEERVVLYLDRSIEYVVGALAAWKAGGAYVPIDPDYPQERIDFIVADVGARVVLTTSALRSRLSASVMNVICLDQELEAAVPFQPVTALPDQLAYLIYTSGSTGQPKGVAVTRRNLVNLVEWHQQACGFSSADRVSQVAGLGFDAVILELWPSLAAGAAVYLVDEKVRLSPEGLRDWLLAEGITVSFVPTPMTEALLELSWPERAPLRFLLTGGDRLRRYPPAGLPFALINNYGPAENTVVSTISEVRPSDSESAPTIGRQLPNVHTYVLDEGLRPVPIGVIGELYLGGVNLARGYWGRAVQTAERFVPHPFSSLPGERLYRTGDLVRYRSDGELEFIGRTDFQVKIRGFRIELSEIELVLQQHPAVKSAIVLALEIAGDKQLVAYYVLRPGADVELHELRAYLGSRLPGYMVPTVCVSLPALPVNANGKVDRTALPVPAAEDLIDLGESEAPRNPVEELLAGLWHGLLPLQEPGVHRSFFDAGGHSILAIRLATRINQAFNVNIPVQAIFEYPTIAGQAQLIQELVNVSAGSSSTTLVPQAHEGPLPLSFNQRQLWFMDRLVPGNSMYSVPLVLNITGAVDPALLERSLNVVVERHAILRTVYRELEGGPAQEILADFQLALPVADLRSQPEKERAAWAHALLSVESRLAFNLATGPVVRALLIRLTDTQAELFLNIHHIATDGWSLGIIVRELGTIYRALKAGQAPALPALPIQYADFAVWQQQMVREQGLEASLAYWKSQFAHGTPRLELLTDHPRPSTQRFVGATLSRALPKGLYKELEALSRRENATLFMVMLAAFQVLLSRYTHQNQIVVGTPWAGRMRSELDDLIGFFVNVLPFRSDLSGDPSFRELLAQVRRSMVQAQAYQDLPLEKLVETLGGVRDLSSNPLFQVIFALQTPLPAVEFPDFRLEVAGGITTETAKFDLNVTADVGPEGLSVLAEYSTDLFEPETMALLLERFQVLLEGIAAYPDAAISELPLLTEGDLAHLAQWTAAPAEYPREAAVAGLFVRQAAETPEAVAVVWPATAGRAEQRLTYRELDERSNRLAHYLRRLGVGPDVLVGLCVERSIEMVVGLLGILKAGGAYLPLDPTYPQERLALMLEDAQAPVLLVQARLEANLPPHRAQVVRLDADWGQIARESAAAPAFTAGPEHLAYVIYTSGSTGRPKGTGIPQRAIVRLVKGTNYAEFGPGQVILQLATISFDASTFEVWGALLSGARLVLLPSMRPTFEELSQVLQEQQVSLLFITTGLFNQMVESQLDGLLSVNRILTGGEAISLPHAQKMLERMPAGHELVNIYGPTENTTYTTFFPMAAGYAIENGVPIGRPIANTTIYVLDRAMRPVPVGVPGELYTGGDGLARGYLNRPGLTAEKFVPDPFSAEPGARLYGTGDWVRWRPDGALEFLGRIDNQVKIRGFRIEPGEIEAVLIQHPEVKETAVVVSEIGGDRQLVAYVAGKGINAETQSSRDAEKVEDGKSGRSEGWSSGSNFQLPTSSPVPATSSPALSASRLRSYLTGRLPAYMIPAAFVVLETMPLNANGKVDRAALPAPFQGRDATGAGDAPRTLVEEMVLDIWQSILPSKVSGVHQNFFEMGGHSILAIRLASRLGQVFKVELPVQTIFEQSTVAGQAQVIQKLLSAGFAEALPALVAVSKEGPLPLSFSQRQLWFLDQLAPGNPMYNVPLVLGLTGALDLTLVERSLQLLVQRHGALRTIFREVAGEPVQEILPELAIPLPVVDLRDLPEAERPARATVLLNEEARRPFVLAGEPVVRALLLRLKDDYTELLLNIHHIATDGWSMGVIVRELSALYEALAAGESPVLPELPVQYTDFAIWQQQMLQSQGLEASLAYWKGQFAGAVPQLELPTDHPRPAVQSFAGATLTRSLPPALLEGLETLSRRENATLFMTLLAAFQVLLGRYANQTDIVVGTPWAGRTRPELDELIGFFVNVLPLRSDLEGNPAFRELLARVRQNMVQAQAYQDLPFEKLVDALGVSRDLSANPLFQVVFAFQPAGPRAEAAGVQIEVAGGIMTETAKFDLNVTVEMGAGDPIVLAEYSTDLFEPATVARLLERYQTLLEGIVAQPEARIAELPLATAAELEALELWCQAPSDYPREATIAELFVRQAAERPESVAVIWPATAERGEQRMTYRELDERSNRLAHYLRRLGVGPDVLVGLCVERSMEMVVGLLGILKAGGAYLPLDPNYPRERLAMMLDDAQVPVLLVQARLAAVLPPHQAQVVRLDADREEMDRESATAPEFTSGPEHLAYVIYTSGSTGRPKGTAIPQRAVVRLVKETNYADFGPEQVLLQLATISFDASTYEVWGALLNGGRLVLYPGSRPTFEELSQVLQQQQVSLLFITTGLFNQMVESQLEGLLSVSRVLTGGEAMSLPHAQRMLERMPDGHVLANIYGPTENTTYTTFFPMEPGYAIERGAPIGRPIANSTVYVLDRSMRPVPAGVPGELYTGGDGLARGYLHRPGLTAEKFVPDPFSGEPGARLYRTGDLVRWSPDGMIEFLGRIDNQVKIRGFRIEPGEIEAVLAQHPAVQEVLVLVREETPGQKVLVAYLVVDSRQQPVDSEELKRGSQEDGKNGSLEDGKRDVHVSRITHHEIRDYLKGRLPEYMIPGAFVMLDSFPLTPMGKVDRAALPAPQLGRRLDEIQDLPRNPVEELLAEIWCRVLKLDAVGIYDNFFELGGHSLLATQIVSRVRSTFQVQLPLRTIFEAPTVAELAVRIAGDQEALPWQSMPLVPAAREGDLPLSFSQERLWFLDQWDPGATAFNMPVVLRMTGMLNVPALERSLQELAARHESLRTTFRDVAGTPVQLIVPTLDLTPARIDLTGLEPAAQEAAVVALIQEDLDWSFDLQQGPLFRVRLAQLGAESHVLLMNMHHIISDGWSISVLIMELDALYRAFVAGGPSPLPPLPVQYADYAIWQRRWLQGSVMEAQVAYWKEQLGGHPAPLDLPTDRPRPPVQTFRGGVANLQIAPEVVQALKGLSQEQNSTLFMVLLAAFDTLLHRYSQQSDILVGTPIAGRQWREVEGLIGFFLNTLVLRVDFSGEPTFREVVQRVREVTLKAYAHQDVPFEKLLAELQLERDLSRTPLFQVFFNMTNLPGRKMDLPGLQVEEIPLPGAESKFDMTLYVNEDNGVLDLALLYNADLFSAERMEELLRQYHFLLMAAVQNPDRPVAHFTLVTEAARAVLPDPALPLDDGWPGPVYELFSARARQHPDRLALSDPRERWSYGELEARANQLAHYLIAQGVRPQDPVAIYGHRSASLVWGVMGVLKAGGAFVILDPSYPATKIQDVLELAQPRAWLQVEAAGEPPALLRSYVAELNCVAMLTLPGRSAAASGGFLADYSTEPPAVKAGQEDLAYLAFTSGSTGKPKGIMGRHGPLSHFLPWQSRTFDLRETDRYSMLSGLAHDPLHRDMFTSLCLGAALYAPDPERIAEPGWLARWMHEQQVTVAHLTPAMLQILTQTDAGSTDARDVIPSLRRAFTVGDVLTRRDVARLYQVASQAICVNFYGSTETQRAVGYLEIGRDLESMQRETIPLGRGMKDVQLLVLNARGELAGVGEMGEIYVRSPHLARGYRGQPELTAEKFLVNPFRPVAGDRIYRTGDLGRYLPDGTVEFQGRTDFQVKIRGFRIELGEIEGALKMHPAVKDVVVVTREIRGEKRLVAYVVPEGRVDSRQQTVDSLRDYLRERLPDYMIPSAFVMLAELPLTPNRKIDRAALPDPEVEAEAESSYAAPRTPVETTLAEIWAQVLGVERVGINDNFFNLGGHSLLATQLVARTRQIFGSSYSLHMLFESPTVAGAAAAIGSRFGTVQPGRMTASRGTGGRKPLSFAQQRLWFLEQLTPGEATYNLALTLRLTGPLDRQAAERSIQEIVRRHDVLRTTFAVDAGGPVQVVAAMQPLAIPFVDLAGFADPEAELQIRLATESRRPFDLSTGPLFRLQLFRLGESLHLLFFGWHHVIADGWSAGVFTREFISLYDDFRKGQSASLPELRMQYADYAVDQQVWLKGAEFEAQLAYWKGQLQGLGDPLVLPTDRARPPVQTSAGAWRRQRLSPTLTTALRKLCQEEGWTLFQVLLAAFDIMLYRYTGQTDLVVGVPFANRAQAELEAMIGFFVNTLALRVDLGGRPTFRELLERVRTAVMGAYAHPELPFEKLVEELQPERNLSYSPIFQVMMIMQNAAGTTLTLPDLTVYAEALHADVAKFDLSLLALEWGEEELEVGLEYNTDLFDSGTIDRMLGAYTMLLEGIVRGVGQAISDLSLLPESEVRRQLVEWNATETAVSPLSLAELFERQAVRNASAPALLFGETVVTYGELDRRANRLAHALRRLGVGPDVPVALCVERSAEMVVGLLGILKAGGAYLPIDPAYPADRIAFVLEDSRTPVLLTQRALLSGLPAHGAQVLCLDEAADLLSQEPETAPEVRVSGENLAYILYTSGSTGRPKGVQIPQRAIVNFLESMARRPGMGAQDTLLAVTTLSFDIAGLELWLPLSVGARIVLASRETAGDGLQLRALLEKVQPTMMQATPVTWQMLLAAGWQGQPDLKILCGGEALPGELARTLLSRGAGLWNLYGPTETTVWSMVDEVKAGEPVTIGHPIANTEIYILDEHLNPLPIGALGELYIGGMGLARGYFRRPGLTAEKFVPHPFAAQPGARLYRTGDLARYRSDGKLEFLGRIDHQVKIHGFRIELGEIEEALLAHPTVKEAVVVARETQGEKRLVAYIVEEVDSRQQTVDREDGKSGRVEDAEEDSDFRLPTSNIQSSTSDIQHLASSSEDVGSVLSEYLRGRVPVYMVPAAFVLLEALPLTPNRKIDRKALPEPDWQVSAEEAYEAPRNPVEETLAGMWSRLLGVERVGIHDSFFRLGGHSLLATHLVAQIRDVFALEIPLRYLFETPTIAGLAQSIATLRQVVQEWQSAPSSTEGWDEGEL